jgi:ElaB/YqjD/DUF883 family membrane-anchored ribosome-binding protein
MASHDTHTSQNGQGKLASIKDKLGPLADKASSFLQSVSENGQVQKATGWVKSNPRLAAGIGAALGVFLLNRMRRRS